MHALIVEDDPDVQYLIEYMLTSKGFTTESASSGVEAIELEWGRFDCAVVDFMLGGGPDGVMISIMLRKFGIPVTILTSAPGAASDRMSELGVEIPIVSKPFVVESLFVAWNLENFSG